MHAFFEHDGPLAVAHRGGAGEAPQNTMAAFAHAVEVGFGCVETDVRLTADGVLVLAHDPDFDTPDGPVTVAETSWEDLRRVRLDGEPPARLGDLLDAWPDLRLNLDLKSDEAVEPLLRHLRRAAILDRVCIGSFSVERLRHVRDTLGRAVATSMGPREVRLLKAASLRLLPRAAVPRAPMCVQVPPRHGRFRVVDRWFVSVAHRLGKPVHVWTVDEPDEMTSLLDLGVDGLMTDRPTVLRNVLADRGQWRPRG